MKSLSRKVEYIQVHTLNIKKKISSYEVARICRNYNVVESYDSNNEIGICNIKHRGIKRLTIKQIAKANRTKGFIHYVELEINAVKLIGKTEAAMIEMSPNNAEHMFKTIDKYLQSVLQLDIRNANCRVWTLIRLDCGLDVVLPDDILVQFCMMRIMNRSLNLMNRSNCSLPPYIDKLSGVELNESIRFSNTQYTYNIYLKALELAKKYPNIPQSMMQEVRNILRIEIQLNSIGVSKKVGSPQQFCLLADAKITRKLLLMVVNDMKKYFGVGQYVPHEDAVNMICNAQNTEQDLKYKMLLVCEAAYKYGFQRFVNAAIKEARVCNYDEKVLVGNINKYVLEIEKLGISIGGIDDMRVVNSIKNINEYIADLVVFSIASTHRKKGVFSKIATIEGGKRMKCQPILKNELGESKRYQFTGVTREVVERKVLDEGIRKNLNENYGKAVTREQQQSILAQAKDEVERFRTIVQSKSVLADVDALLNKIQARMVVS